jgi:hypothetical protein
VPIALGYKAPCLINPRTGRWTLIPCERYLDKPATPDDVERWFTGAQPMGIGIIAGPLSGVTPANGTCAGLEFLDTDDTEIHRRFIALVAARGALALLQGMPCEATPGGGRHYGYCCVEWSASTTLARRQGDATRDGRATTVPLFETRGQGSLHRGTHPAKDSPGPSCATVLGVPTSRVGQGFLCILPEHAETSPRPACTGTEDRRHRLSRLACPQWRGVVYAARRARLSGLRPCGAPARALRGDVAAPVAGRVGHPRALPRPGPPPPARGAPRCSPGVRGLCVPARMQVVAYPQAPTPFSWRLAAAWSGVGERHVGEAMRWLLAHGFLRPVSRDRQLTLFLPGRA